MIKTIPSDPKVITPPSGPTQRKVSMCVNMKDKRETRRCGNIYSNQLSIKAALVKLKTEADQERDETDSG